MSPADNVLMYNILNFHFLKDTYDLSFKKLVCSLKLSPFFGDF